MLVTSVQVMLDFILLTLWQRGDFAVQVGHTVVDVHAQLFEGLGVFIKRIFVEDFYAMTKDDRVRHLHHGGLHVQ